MNTQNDITNALHSIPADLPRKEWAQVGMAIKASNCSFDIFHNWSKPGKNYKSEKDCFDAWQSFKSGGGINISYLFKVAATHGYSGNNAVKHPFHANPTDWFNSLPLLERHEYLNIKQIKLTDKHGLRTGNDGGGAFIADPLYRLADDSITGFNRIYGEGCDSKKLAPKTVKSGNVGKSGEVFDDSVIYLTEGMADRCHAHQKHSAPAFSASDAGNLKAAFDSIRSKYPNNRIVVIADNDKTGIKAALKAAENDSDSLVNIPLLHKDYSDMVLSGVGGVDSLLLSVLANTSFNDAIAFMQSGLLDVIDNDAAANNSTIDLWISAAVNLGMDNNAVLQQSFIDAVKKKTRLNKPDIKHAIKSKSQQKRLKELQAKGVDNALITFDSNGNEKLVAHSTASRILADTSTVINDLRFDGISDNWLGYQTTHWQLLTDADVDTKVVNAIERQAGDLGFQDNYAKGVKNMLKTRVLNSNWNEKKALISLKNGVFDTSKMQLLPHSKDHYITNALPFDYDVKADCPITKQFLLDCVGNDAGQQQILRAYINCIIKGRADLQRCLVIVGMGGTGKGTFMRLCANLVGKENLHSSNFKHLEGAAGRFETGRLRFKKLLIIPDADQYTGSVETFKSITGQDPLRCEEKNKNNTHNGNFIYDGMAIIASNEPLAVNDHTSGWKRRTLNLTFDNAFNSRDGGLSEKLEAELSGVFNWALAMPDNEVTEYIKNTINKVGSARKLSFDALINGNPLASWVNDNLILKADNVVQIGEKKEVMTELDSGEKVRQYLYENERLYANYLAWCDGVGRKAIALQKFSGLLSSLFKSPDMLNIPESLVKFSKFPLIDQQTQKKKVAAGFSGIAIRTDSDNDMQSPVDFALLNKESSQKEKGEGDVLHEKVEDFTF